MESGEGKGEGDYPPLRWWKEVKSMVWTETLKLWRVAGTLPFPPLSLSLSLSLPLPFSVSVFDYL